MKEGRLRGDQSRGSGTPNSIIARSIGGVAVIALLAGIGACVPPAPINQSQKSSHSISVPIVDAPSMRQPAQLATVQKIEAPAAFQSIITSLGRNFDGVTGIAVHDVKEGWTATYNANSPFPQESVSKLWVAMTVLDAVDRGAASLDDEVVIGPEDLTLFHQPVAMLVKDGGYHTTVRKLMMRQMTQSDNTANDALLWHVGGPPAVRTFLARRGIRGIAFGPGERLLQSYTAGLEWKQSYSQNGAFLRARAALPMEKREAAMERYLAKPLDGAEAEAIALALGRLKKGELLSANSTRVLLDLMARCRTGPQRVRGGIGPGWSYSHKTGTGQDLKSLSIGYNDVGLLTAPDGHVYSVAVMIQSTHKPIRARMEYMQSVSRAIVNMRRNLASR